MKALEFKKGILKTYVIKYRGWDSKCSTDNKDELNKAVDRFIKGCMLEDWERKQITITIK